MNGKDLDRNRGNAHILRKLGLEADRLRLGASSKPCTNRSLGSLRSLPARAGAGGIRMDSTSLTTGPCRMVRDPSAPFGRSGCLWVRQAHHRSLPDSQIPRLPSVARDAYGFGKLTTGPCRMVGEIPRLPSVARDAY